MPIALRVSNRLFGFIKLSTGPHVSPISSRTTKLRSITTSIVSTRPSPFPSVSLSQSPIAVSARSVTVASSWSAYSHRSRLLSTATTVNMGSLLPEASNSIRVLIAGGCYAGLATAANLLDLAGGLTPRQSGEPYVHHCDVPRFDVEITIVDERDGYYHLIGTPLAFADSDYANKAWVKHTELPGFQFPNVKFIQGRLASVDPSTKTATVSRYLTEQKTSHEYDYFVAATGLRRNFPVAPQSLTRKQYLIEAGTQIKACENAKHGVVVVGGGAVGIEMAAELKMVKPHLKVCLVHSRDKLLSSEGLSDETKDVALDLLKESGVEVLMNHRLASTTNVETTDGSVKKELEFTNGHKMFASEVVMAISRPVPSTDYLPSAVLDEEGYVHIHANLNWKADIPNVDYHFAAGDIAKWSGVKRCGAAMHHGHYVAMNIHKRIIEQRTGQCPKFNEMGEVPPMIGLAVGKKAVAYSPAMGTTYGEDVAHAYFRDDLGWGICWNWMGLGGRKVEVKA